MATLYGRKNEGLDDRQQYTNAALAASQYNARSPAIGARAPGEALGARLRHIQQGRNLEADTFRARSIEAQQAAQAIQNQGGQLGFQALMDAQRTGDWGGYNNRLADIGNWQNNALGFTAGRSMQQFRNPTMANFERRTSLGNVMDAAQARTADQLMRWASLGVGLQEKELDRQMEQARFDYQMGRDEQGDVRYMTDRADDLAWRNAQLERDLRSDRYERRQDRLQLLRHEHDFGLKEEESLLRRGYSDQAVEAYRQGDSSLLDQERESGQLERRGPGLSRTGSRSGSGRKAELSAEDKLYMNPGDNPELVNTILDREGFSDVFQMPDEKGKLVPDEAARAAFDQQLPISFERTGDKQAAIRDAIRTVAPERYGSAVLTRAGLTGSKLLEGRDIGGKVAEASAQYESLGADGEDADVLAAGTAFMSELAAAFKERGDTPELAAKNARGLFASSHKDFAKTFDATLKRYKEMDSEEPADDETAKTPTLTRKRPKELGAKQKGDLGETLDSVFLQALKEGKLQPGGAPALERPRRKYEMGETRDGRRISGRISFGQSDARYGQEGRILAYGPTYEKGEYKGEPDPQYRPTSVSQNEWNQRINAPETRQKFLAGIEARRPLVNAFVSAFNQPPTPEPALVQAPEQGTALTPRRYGDTAAAPERAPLGLYDPYAMY